jgi:hypothetical protein
MNILYILTALLHEKISVLVESLRKMNVFNISSLILFILFTDSHSVVRMKKMECIVSDNSVVRTPICKFNETRMNISIIFMRKVQSIWVKL